MKIVRSLFRKKRTSEGWLKYISYLLHLWLGIASSLVLIVVCLSGAVYSLKNIVEPLAASQVSAVTPPSASAKALPVDSLIRTFEAEQNLSPNYIRISPGKAVLLRYGKRGGASTSVYYNPYSGLAQGSPSQGIDSFFKVVMQLHRWLLVRQPGKIIVGSSVLIFAFLLISGFVLWWPSRKNARKRAFSMKLKGGSLYRKMYDWHKVMGFYTLIPVFFLVITGLYISFDWVRNGITLSLGGTVEKHEHNEGRRGGNGRGKETAFRGGRNQAKQGRQQGRQQGGEGKRQRRRQGQRADNATAEATPRLELAVPLQETLDKVYAKTAYEGETTVFMPRKPGGAMRVTRYNTHNLLAAKLPDRVRVKNNGALSWEPFSEKPLNKQFSSLVKGLHTGELFLPWVSLFYFFLALVAASLPITGLYMWIKRM